MKVLVTGGRGQLGRSLCRMGAHTGHTIVARDVDQLDVCDAGAIERSLDEIAPELVINGAAYTAVDRAESEPERAFAINRDGAGALAALCERRRVPLLHVSTDYVFDGLARQPYREDSAPAAINVYGQSKLEGEMRVLAHGGAVVRTSWLFEQDGPSFVHTMLRLAAERDALRVVADQYGCPTWADDLAKALLEIAARGRCDGVYHYCGDGPTTWHGFAERIVDLGRRLRPLRATSVEAITTLEYPTPAKRPLYTVLGMARVRELGIAPAPWSEGLARVVAHVLRET